MKIVAATAQIAPYKGEIQKNLGHILEILLTSQSEGVDLLVFPETCVSGYFLEGGVQEHCLSAADLSNYFYEGLKSSQKDIDFVVGFYEFFDGTVYNSSAYFEYYQGELSLKKIYRKLFPPTYGVFDEKRFVGCGKELGCFESRFGKVALHICEDIWHSILPTLNALSGAQIMIVSSASPGREMKAELPENVKQYESLMKGISQEHGVFCINSMLFGFEGGKGLSGGSLMTDPTGQVLCRSPIMQEDLLICKLDLEIVKIARAQLPLLSNLQDRLEILKEIVSEI